MKVGFLHSIIRKEEKLLLQEFRSRDGVELIKIDDRQQFFDLHQNPFDVDVIVERCVNHSRALHAMKIFSDHGMTAIEELVDGGGVVREAAAKHGLEHTVDYLMFLDSTMIRLWSLNERARGFVESVLNRACSTASLDAATANFDGRHILRAAMGGIRPASSPSSTMKAVRAELGV